MRTTTLVLAAAGLAAFAPLAEARVNSTGAIATFMISDCGECTRDKDSIFCTEAAADDNYVKNSTTTITIAQKKRNYGLGPADGAKFCWEGTFGSMLNNQGGPMDVLGSSNITANLQCAKRQLFYRQCVIPAEMAIALIAVAAFLCVCGSTCVCFVCGCCKCLNNKGDVSKWGMCNRFCPWMPCADPPEKDDDVPKYLQNPLTEQENKSSLFGKNESLNAMKKENLAGEGGAGATAGAVKSPLSDLKKPGGFGDLKKPKQPLSSEV